MATKTMLGPVSPSSRMQEAREAAKRLRFGSPKLIDILRTQSRNRMRERRAAGFIRSRNIMASEEKSLKAILEEEFQKDLELQDLVYAEMMSEMEQWIEEEMQYLENLERSTVVCPICQKRALEQVREDRIACGCGSQFEGTLENLSVDISRVLETHSCNNVSFYSERPNNLNVVCFDCDFFGTVRH